MVFVVVVCAVADTTRHRPTVINVSASRGA